MKWFRLLEWLDCWPLDGTSVLHRPRRVPPIVRILGVCCVKTTSPTSIRSLRVGYGLVHPCACRRGSKGTTTQRVRRRIIQHCRHTSTSFNRPSGGLSWTFESVRAASYRAAPDSNRPGGASDLSGHSRAGRMDRSEHRASTGVIDERY